MDVIYNPDWSTLFNYILGAATLLSTYISVYLVYPQVKAARKNRHS